MSNKRGTLKLLPIWCAVSAVFLIAGIILLALLGFNYQSEIVKGQSVEVEYGVATHIGEGGEDALDELCQKTFSVAGVSLLKSEKQDSVGSSDFVKDGSGKFVYTFAEGVSLEKAVENVKTACAAYAEKDTDFFVSEHPFEASQRIYFESGWRGAIASGVAALVGLIYIGIRFGVGSALTGLVVCAHDAVLTMAILAIARIPVYFYAPLVYIALASLVSVVVWMLQCMKIKENFKSPEFSAYTAEEAVEQSRKTSRLVSVIFVGALALVVIVAGAVATAGSRLFFLPALLPVALPLYSNLLLGPAVHVHVKAAFDGWKAKRASKNKKKPVKTAETEFGK